MGYIQMDQGGDRSGWRGDHARGGLQEQYADRTKTAREALGVVILGDSVFIGSGPIGFGRRYALQEHRRSLQRVVCEVTGL